MDEIREFLRRPEDPLARRQAKGALSSQFEEESIVGSYSEAIESLQDGERELLFAMALNASDADDMHVDWLLKQISDLSDPRIRSAVLDFVGRIDPHSWLSTQWGMSSTLSVVHLLARFGVERPTMRATQEPEGWEAFIDLVEDVLRDGIAPAADGRSERTARRMVDEQWTVLVELLAEVRFARMVMYDDELDLEGRLINALGDGLAKVLLRGLEHPDQLRSPFRFSRAVDRNRYTVGLLGRIGDAHAADVLRRFADDYEIGTAAAEAVREIERRREGRGTTPEQRARG